MSEENRLEGKKVTENIWLCPDGVYRWTYNYDLLRNPTVMFTVWKVLGISLGAVVVLELIFKLFNGIDGAADLLGIGEPILILVGILLVLSLLGYIVVGIMYGWKYQVLFEMTEDYVSHIQMPKQFEKAQALGWLTAAAGAAAGSPGTMGIGMNAASRNSMTTELKNVAVLKVRPRRDTIHVDLKLDKNQVYAEAADFAFVEQFLKTHCPNAKIK